MPKATTDEVTDPLNGAGYRWNVRQVRDYGNCLPANSRVYERRFYTLK